MTIKELINELDALPDKDALVGAALLIQIFKWVNAADSITSPE